MLLRVVNGEEFKDVYIGEGRCFCCQVRWLALLTITYLYRQYTSQSVFANMVGIVRQAHSS